MKPNQWKSVVAKYNLDYSSVASVDIAGACGSILHIPGISAAAKLVQTSIEASWRNGICCEHLYSAEIEKSMDRNYEIEGFRSWSPVESWIALFESVTRSQIFPIVGHLCEGLNNCELKLIEDLFSAVDWCSPLMASNKVLRIAVSQDFVRDIDANNWYSRYRDISYYLYGNSYSKSDFLRLLDKNIVSFLNLKH